MAAILKPSDFESTLSELMEIINLSHLLLMGFLLFLFMNMQLKICILRRNFEKNVASIRDTWALKQDVSENTHIPNILLVATCLNYEKR